MKKDEHFSEEQINALVDGELDPEEKSRLYSEAGRSPDLELRLCRQRRLKELVKHAYEDLPSPVRAAGMPLAGSSLFSKALVAGLLLTVGLAVGFLARGGLDPREQADSVPSASFADAESYILHVVSGEPEQMLAALEEARQLLDSATPGEFRQVEIVANERGLDLLRSDVTPYADEIRALQASDVVFYACSRTIERLEERGVAVELVPDANRAYTALDRVVLRMKDGWQYIKI